MRNNRNGSLPVRISRILVVTFAVVLLTAAGPLPGTFPSDTGNAISPAAWNQVYGKTRSRSGKYIGVNRAKNIALTRARLKHRRVIWKKAKLEKKKGRPYYDLIFVRRNLKYQYRVKVDARTQKIRYYNREKYRP